jgi:hypothetical protein
MSRTRGRPDLGFCDAHMEKQESTYTKGGFYMRPACGYDTMRVIYMREAIWDEKNMKYKYQFTAIGKACTKCGTAKIDTQLLKRCSKL